MIKISLLSLIILIITSFLFSLSFPIFYNFITNEPSSDLTGLTKVGLVVTVILMAFIGVANKWPQYYNEFRFSATQNSIINIIIRILGLGIGVFYRGYTYGLIVAEFAGRTISSLAFLIKYGKVVFGKGNLALVSASTIKRYSHYPLFLVPTRYLNILLNQLVLILVSTHYSLSLLGQLGMASSLITYPLSLLGNSMSPVFLRRIRDSDDKELGELVERLTLILLAITIIPVILTMFFIRYILNIFLGSGWEDAGVFASIIISSLVHDLVYTVISGVFQLRNWQRQNLMISLIVCVVYIFAYWFISGSSVTVFDAVIVFSALRILFSASKCSYIFFSLGLRNANIWSFVSALILLISLFLLRITL